MSLAGANTFSVLCYNVAGLPAIISSGNPEVYSVEMGKRISDWDIVNVQEDFNYHAYLYKQNTQKFRTATSGGVPFGSGLNTLSNIPFSTLGLDRIKWSECSNDESADCMTPKGFTVQAVQLADGAVIDVYNLHADAGTSDADQKARASNLKQLGDYITANSAGNAVVVMGDTNTRYTRKLDTIAEFVADHNLTDGWIEYIRKGDLPKKGAEAIKCETANMTNDCEVVDKIMFRGGKHVTLTLDKWNNENKAFLGKDGTALSDHPPISSTFSWSASADYSLSSAYGGPHGVYFTDLALAEPGQTVSSVTIRGERRVDAVTLDISDPTETILLSLQCVRLMLPVKVGDVLEFDPLSASTDGGGGSSSPTKADGRSLTTGRVVEVNPEEEGGDGRCTVQVSPYEPLQPLDLKKTFYKVVYEAGELRSLSSLVVGWEIELESVDTKRLEHGVVKQVDCDINCALVLFAGGRKEWLDLTFFRVKVPGHPITSRDRNGYSDCALGNGAPHSPPSHEEKQSEVWESPKQYSAGREAFGISDTVASHSPLDFSLAVSPLSIPRVGPEQFEWHLEGAHVELCDRDGQFLEGAALCSKTNRHLQLYNERREFFEVDCTTQGFKAVIHGLETLTQIPMGQIVDVYSPLIGRFRSGTVLKAAVFGHLTPIRFATNKAVEWLDLKSQTFKLVFLPHTTNAVEDCGTRVPKSPREHSPHRAHGHDLHRSQNLEYPHLLEDQEIEIFDDHSKQYLKYKVAAQSNWSSHAYIFKPLEIPSGSTSTHLAKHIVSPLAQLHSRLLLQPAQWKDYHRILAGHRVDVYDRVGKNVVNGKVHAVGGVNDSRDEPAILVCFNNGHQTWVDLCTTKVKLRLHPAADASQTSGPAVQSEMSPRTKMDDTTDVPSSPIAFSSEISSSRSSSDIAAAHPTKTKLPASKSDQALAQIPSMETSENLEGTLPQLETPSTGGSPGRRPSPGKRVHLQRRASQSADVPKNDTLPGASEQPVLAASNPSKVDNPLVPALNVVQSPRLSDSMRPISSVGPLPPVQVGSNPNSPSKTQLPVGPLQAPREPNLGTVAPDHEHTAH
ncbi:hypothetical protein PHYPSEUDO_009897 [Phytophthora pseudosyringae]|uniref:Inositol polyphosphate-related phosphatase domain-containing protein n=1 Tax=Phytophthora pseudosyringae TaxID=221518 RepID=A0A8T1VEL0_9STRA|nr:hypothetical protein PHYPSEUDO_009897 [Phytophthora pseudosyringae]